MADGSVDMHAEPTVDFSVRDVFGLDSDLVIKGFAEPSERVPAIDESYRFDHDTTLAILAGYRNNRRVMVQGYHGTGKSTHIEQIGARLNWPTVRVNLDQPHQPDRPDRKGCHQATGRQAGHCLSGRHPALGAA